MFLRAELPPRAPGFCPVH